MIIEALAPSRISLFGGGSDTSYYAENFGGLCLNMAINLRHRIVLGREQKLTSADNPDFFKAFTDQPILHEYTSDIESGLGSSAALAVALVGALARQKGEKLIPDEIAEKAWDVEVNKLKLFGGKQDQYASVFGGINVMEFNKEVKVTPLSRDFADKIVPYLVLFHTGITRKSPKIQEGLKVLDDSQVFHLTMIKNMAVQGIEAIAKGDVNQVAELMKQAWESKKASNKGVTNEEIDRIYADGLEAGALAGKLLGSGGGGHILFIVTPEKKQGFVDEMVKKGLKWIDFSISWDGLETRVIG